jgi:hypothetical protein
MAEEMNRRRKNYRGFRPGGLREYPDKKGGYLGCDRNPAVVV